MGPSRTCTTCDRILYCFIDQINGFTWFGSMATVAIQGEYKIPPPFVASVD